MCFLDDLPSEDEQPLHWQPDLFQPTLGASAPMTQQTWFDTTPAKKVRYHRDQRTLSFEN